MVEFLTTAARCRVIIIFGSCIIVAHCFHASESYHARIPSFRYTSIGGALCGFGGSSGIRITTTRAMNISSSAKRLETTIIFMKKQNPKSKSYNFSQLDDLWANDEVGGGREVASSLPSIIGSDVNNIDIAIQDSASSTSTSESTNTKLILICGTVLVLVAAWALAVAMGNELGMDLEFGELMKDPSSSLDKVLKSLETIDAQKGMIYFSSFYILAEILAIPAVPILTASSGYLFGLIPGTATCLFSAVVAASISFVIGRTYLRGYVESVLADNPKFRAMDRAIDKGGFKLMLITRLSPLFPFALSNYLFGASSIQFPNYVFGTVLGFLPGTFAYVYAGSVGKALTIDSASSKPWYVYLGGMAVIIILLKIAGDVASSVINSLEDDAGDLDIS